MTPAERYLYHQLHPLKLLADFTTSFASTWLFWQRAWFVGLLVSLPPSLVVSAALLWRADLERYRDTPLGRYVAGFMSRKVESLRFGGQAVMWAGAGAHVPWLLPLGFVIIVFAWLGGFYRRAT